MEARSWGRVGALCALLVACLMAAWWPVTTAFWSGEDLVLLTVGRERGWWETLTEAGPSPYFRPLWTAHVKVVEELSWSPRAAHLSVLMVHGLGLAVLLAAALRARLPSVDAFLGCLLAGLMPGAADALAWFAAGNKVWSFFWTACLLAAALSRLHGALRLLLVVLFQALAVASSENSYGNVLLVPLVLWAAARGAWVRPSMVPLGAAAVLLPMVGHLFLLPEGTAGRGVALLGGPLRAVAALATSTSRHAAHTVPVEGLGEMAVRGPLLLVYLGALAAAALKDRRPAVVAGVAAVVAANLPAGLVAEAGRHQAYLPSLALGLCAAAAVWCLRWRPVRWLVLLAAAAAAAGAGRAHVEPYLRHFQRLEQVVRVLEADDAWREPGVRIGLLNWPYEFTPAPVYLEGEGDLAERLVLWHMVGTEDLRIEPPGEGVPGMPRADLWLEYHRRGLRRVSPEAIEARPAAPDAWLVRAPGRGAPSAPPVGPLPASLDPRSQDPALGSARLLAHRFDAQDLAWEWEVEAAVERPALLVLPYVPGPLPWSEWVGRNAYAAALPPGPLWVSVLGAAGEPVEVPVRFVLHYFPALRLEAGSHRLRARGRLRW